MEIGEICQSLAAAFRGRVITVFSRYNANHKIVQLIDSADVTREVDVFLNSYANDDYLAVVGGNSTLLAMPFDPIGTQCLARFAADYDGFYRQKDGDDWVRLGKVDKQSG